MNGSSDGGTGILFAWRMKQAASDILTPYERRRLKSLLAESGERKLLDQIGLSRSSLARVLAGLPVRRGTLELVRAGLRKFEAADTFGELTDANHVEHHRDARVADARKTNGGVDDEQ